MKRLRSFLVLAFLTIIPLQQTTAAPGDLDLSFNGTGKVTTPIGSSSDEGQSVAVQPDGKIVVAGYSYNGSTPDIALVRYTSAGALDTSFGSAGKVTTDIGGGEDKGQSVAVQSDGKIVVAGSSMIGSTLDFALVRYTSAGALDTSFGVGGKVTTPIGSSHDYGESVVLQCDGKIVVAGYSVNGSTYVFALVRYTSAGALDTSFGVGGKVTTPIGNSDTGYSVALQSDGKILVAGQTYDGSNYDFALVRYTSAGTLDTSFGSGGKVTTPIGSSHDYGQSVALQSDGKIVVAGYSVIGSTHDFALVRYTSAGSVDTSFGSGGKVTTDVGNHDYGQSVAVQSDGKIVVAGMSNGSSTLDFALVRYTSVGALDTSFGIGGKVTTTVGSDADLGRSVASQSDGKIIVAGHSFNGSDYDFALARYDGLTTTTTNRSATLNTTNLFVAPTAGQAEIYNTNGWDITASGLSSIGENGVGVLNHSGGGAHSTPNLYVGRNVGAAGTYNQSAGGVTVGAGGLSIIGNEGQGTYDQTGGSHTAPRLFLGSGLNGNGVYRQRGGGLSVTGELKVGVQGVGRLEHSSGTVSASPLTIADQTTGNGSYFLTGGTLSTSNTLVGHNGPGTFTQTGGTHTVTGSVLLGDVASGTGTFNLEGGTLTLGDILGVGAAGGGTFNHTGGDVSTNFLRVGTVAGATGQYQLSGTGTVTTTSNLGVGFASNGTFSQSGGTLNVGGILSVGRASTGTMTQSGGTSTVTGGFFVGEQSAGTGTYTLSAGTLTINGHSHVGFNGTGTLTVSSGIVNLGTTKDLYFGTNATGAGTLNANGGTLTGRELVIANDGTSTGTVNINGGTLNFTNIRTGAGSKTIVFSKGTVNATGTAISPGAGGLMVGDGTNAATLNLGNGSHTISNGLRINPAATLSLAGSNLGGMLVALQGGKIMGNGTVGTFTATSGSMIDLGGSSASTLTTTGNVTLAAGVSYNVDLVSGPASDQINVSGTVDLASAFLNITLRFAPAIGQVFTIVQNDGTDAVTGTFNGKAQDSIHTLTNVGVGGGTYKAQISYTGGTGNDGVLRIVDAPVVTLAAVSGLTATSATINGTVNPQGAPTTAQFEYGLTTSYGSTVSVTLSPNNGTTVQNVSASLTGLTPNTTYHYRLTATNAVGTSVTTDGSFTTLPVPEIRVFAGANDAAPELTDGQAAVVDFGSTVLGTPVTRSFTVKNVGSANLHVTGISFPAAYELVGAALPYDVSPNATATFQVRFLAHTVHGTFSGAMSLTNDDADEGTFDFPVTAVAAGVVSPVGGTLDPTFGTAGKLTTSIGGSGDYARSVVVQPDGKIVVAGYGYVPASGEDFALVRYSTDGSIDTSFGSAGKVKTPVGSGDDRGFGAALQGDGKTVVAGAASNGSNWDIAVARYTSAGALDTTFGSGGKVVTPVGSGDDVAYSVAVQSDGKIVVAGYSANGSNNDFVMVRYTSTGTLDAGFGSGGKVVTPVGSSDDLGFSVVIQSDGKIIVAGVCNNGTDDFALVRYTSTGALDAGFGSSGKVITPVGGSYDFGQSVVLQTDGKIIVGGFTSNSGTDDFALVRYTSTGVPDASFGSGGKVITPVGSGGDRGYSMAMQTDGKIVVAGYSSNGTDHDFALARFTSAGIPDASFGSGGKATTDFNAGFDIGYDVAIQSDGKIIVVGSVDNSGVTEFGVARYDGQTITYPEPTVVTFAATSITTATATLNGTVNPNGIITNAWFQYGLTTSYGQTTTSQPKGYGTSASPVSAALNGLTSGTLYHYRLVAQNGETTAYGADLTFTTLTLQQGWRQQYFGISTNTGDAADSFDYDKDGLVNLLEWACNLNPTTASTLPATTIRNGAFFEFTYTRSVAALNAGAIFTVEWSDTLPGTSWSSTGVNEQLLPDNGTVQQVKATVPAGSSGHRFVRLKVTAPP